MIYIVILIVVGLVVGIVANSLSSKKGDETPPIDNRPDDCCGAHEICENESLLNTSETIIYYEDEELDNYRGKEGKSYVNEEIEEFREVLYTLKENEVSGWLNSLRLRGVNPPDIVKEEALMIVAERRK